MTLKEVQEWNNDKNAVSLTAKRTELLNTICFVRYE